MSVRKKTKNRNKKVYKTKPGKFLYAVINGSEEKGYGAIGINGGYVHTITDGTYSAIVSNVPNKKIRPKRSNLDSHNEVVNRLVDETPALPMKFGVIADGEAEVKKVLSDYRDRFLEDMNRVGNRLEMVLYVKWDVPNIFDYFVSTQPELKKARDRYLVIQDNPSRPRKRRNPRKDKIEVGSMFKQILTAEREKNTPVVEDMLSNHFFEVKRDKCRNDKDVMKLCCLVDGSSKDEMQERFEAVVSEAAELFDSNLRFESYGPWAPHSFVDIVIKF